MSVPPGPKLELIDTTEVSDKIDAMVPAATNAADDQENTNELPWDENISIRST